MPVNRENHCGACRIQFRTPGVLYGRVLVYDLDEGNGGTLIFIDGGESTKYVRWSDVRQIRFDRPSTYLLIDRRAAINSRLTHVASTA